MNPLRSALFASLALAACTTGSANTFAGAGVMTGAAIGAAAVSRAQGGCIATCTNGTACNPRTGFCEVLPCRGQCGATEHCEQTFAETKCMPGSQTGVTSVAKGSASKAPGIIPVNTAPASSGPPEVVPKAEQGAK